MTKNGRTIWTDKRAAFFDMDGTLVDSMWMWTDIDQRYLARFPEAQRCDIRLLQKEIEGLGMLETAAYFRQRFSIADPIPKILREWDEMALELYKTRVPLKPGAAVLLQEMKGKGMKLGVCTSNSSRLAGVALEVNGVRSLFDVVLTADEVGRGKPNPDIYLEAAKRTGVSPEDSIVFEDILNGVIAGKRAGMKVCAVSDENYADRQDALAREADYYIQDFREILSCHW